MSFTVPSRRGPGHASPIWPTMFEVRVGQALLWFVATTGCGRLYFGELADARNDTGSSPDDGVALCNPAAPFGTPMLVPGVNDAAAYDSAFDPVEDELTAYFYSDRAGNDDFYVATRPDFQTPFTVAPITALNTPSDDAEPTLSNDGSILAFLSTRAPSDSFGDLWFAHANGSSFTVGGLIANLNSTATDYHPYFQRGSNDFYFSSNRSGLFVIYHSVSLGGGNFAAPTPVPGISTIGNNASAAVSPDGLVMFFRSDRAGGQGDYDIWVSRRTSIADSFGVATPVVEVNSDVVDTPNRISSDGCRLYMTSTRLGSSDVFVATRGP